MSDTTAVTRTDVETRADDRLGGRAPGAGRAGRRGDIRLSRRRGAADLRRDLQAELDPPHPGAPRAGRGARRRGLRPQHRQGRRGAGHLGTGRDQHRDRADRRADGQRAGGLPDRPGADPHDRQRRLPGGRHGRHHPALHQAQLPGQIRRRAGARDPRGVPRRAQRPAGPGGGRPAQGHPDGAGAVHAARSGAPSHLQPAARAAAGADRAGGRADGEGAAADLLRRRRRDQFGTARRRRG